MSGAPHHSESEVAKGSSFFTVSNVLTGLAIGGAVVGVGLIVAPHVLPLLGVTSADTALEAAQLVHGSGIALAANNALAAVPFVGESLAAGGWVNALSAGAVGVGGTLLGNFIEHHEDGDSSWKWGKLLRYAALTTSALIALPTVLTALGTGIVYAGFALEEAGVISLAASNAVIGAVYNTIGSAGTEHVNDLMGVSGLAAALPHFFTCGMPLIPAALTVHQAHQKNKEGKTASDGNIEAQLLTEKPLEPGTPCHATIRLTHAGSGAPVTAQELAVVHTEKLHLFVIDSALRDYQHIHPQPTKNPGEFAFEFTPKTSNRYSAWADVTLMKNQQNHKIKAEFPKAKSRLVPPVVRSNTSATQDGLQFDWRADGALRQGEAKIVQVQVRDEKGQPFAGLQPVMGAFAHLVGFSADGQSLIHTHPLDAEPKHALDMGGPTLRFHVEPHCTGPTQFYLQVKKDGKEVFAPFGQQIQPPEMNSEKIAHSHSHAAHAMR